MRAFLAVLVLLKITHAGVIDRRQAATSSASPSLATTAFVSTLPPATVGNTITTAALATSVSGSSGPCANGAPPARTYTAANGDVYGVCLGTDFDGGNIAAVSGVTTPEACSEACSATRGCIASTFIRRSQVCSIKSSRNTATANVNTDSVYKISQGGPSSTSSNCQQSCSSISTVTTTFTRTTSLDAVTTTTTTTATTTTVGTTFSPSTPTTELSTSLPATPTTSNTIPSITTGTSPTVVIPSTTSPSIVPPTSSPTIISPTISSTINPSTPSSTIATPTSIPTANPSTGTPTINPSTSTPTINPSTSTPTVNPPTSTPTVNSPTSTPTINTPTSTPTVNPPTSTPTINTPTTSPIVSTSISSVVSSTITSPQTSSSTISDTTTSTSESTTGTVISSNPSPTTTTEATSSPAITTTSVSLTTSSVTSSPSETPSSTTTPSFTTTPSPSTTPEPTTTTTTTDEPTTTTTTTEESTTTTTTDEPTTTTTTTEEPTTTTTTTDEPTTTTTDEPTTTTTTEEPTTTTTTTDEPTTTSTLSTTTTPFTTTSSLSAVPTFACPTNGYFVAATSGVPSFYSVDIATGQRTLIKSPLGDGTTGINAIGYNVLDNTLYGVINTSPPQIIRIGAQGQLVYARALPTQSSNYNLGDVDENGDFWVAVAGRNWVQIRISTLAIIASGTATNTLGAYDWAYVPGGGNYLYSIEVDSTGKTFLYRFDRTAHTWAQVGTGYGAIYPANGVVGAVYASQDGFLYGSENTGGKIYRFSLDGKTATFVTTGAVASSNDGAHCINNGAV